MNKRFFLISVILVLGAALASAYSFKVDGLCYDIDCGNSVTVTYEVDSSNSYNTLVGDLHIPESVDYGDNSRVSDRDRQVCVQQVYFT